MDTIFAEATAPGKAGVSVVRISGPDAHGIVRGLAGELSADRVLALHQIKDTEGEVLDHCLAVKFSAPNSFTGEDVVELHLHGSRAVVHKVLLELGRRPGARLAEPGEFTRRALQNGKLDLTQVEGLADLIEAQTEVQRQFAQRAYAGEFRDFLDGLKRDLVRATALLEAMIDFVDEELPEDVSNEVVSLTESALDQIEHQLASAAISERVRMGFEVAIVGRPNVGKSTLLNALAGRDAAITSEYAGTTRDVIEVQMDLSGLPVTLLDTAGLRDADDPVERIGVDRARKRAASADIRVFLVEAGRAPDMQPQQGDITLQAKSDLAPSDGPGVSGLTGAGVDELIGALTERLKNRVSKAGLATRERHRLAFETSVGHLAAARALVLSGGERYDMAAEELRTVLRQLDFLVGRVGVEDLLDVIFSSFCLGK